MLKMHLIHRKDGIIFLRRIAECGQATVLMAVNFSDSGSLIDTSQAGGPKTYFHHN